MAFDWKATLAAIAPTVASALGGPLAGAAVTALSTKLLGKSDAKIEEISPIIAASDPATLVKLKELEIEFQKQMGELGIELEKLEVEDRKDARAKQVALKDWMPNIIAIATVATLLSLLFIMFSHVVPVENKDAFNMLLGMLEGSVLTIMNFEFGSSRSSKDKDEVLGRALNGKE